ncbi:inorganic phosphate transporter [Nonomuraea jiangxiensis]|uniref:Phosphate transporter family protein n=1 Tax=Nonomuraea jiangxiensis TaxID=633440 RepID=A0A1G9F9B1_9ACTN|nr:inorganic phosphate transporter [Nonomuraea jiangxiensis]SDK84976.1 Phosphate transporter family protein [Nonomuraea jiangxiensis]
MAVVVATAPAFDFTNGFHDTANALATSLATGASAIKGGAIVGRVLVPALLAPLAAIGVATLCTYLVYVLSRSVPERLRRWAFRHGQIGSASLVSLAHGTTTRGRPWASSTTPQGYAAESSSAAVIFASSHFGYPLATTQVIGSRLGKRLAEVRWAVAGRMAAAWLITLPAAGARGQRQRRVERAVLRPVLVKEAGDGGIPRSRRPVEGAGRRTGRGGGPGGGLGPGGPGQRERAGAGLCFRLVAGGIALGLYVMLDK